MFNPSFEYLTDEKQGNWEGCLSVPGLRGYVERPSQISVNFKDENLELKKLNGPSICLILIELSLRKFFDLIE